MVAWSINTGSVMNGYFPNFVLKRKKKKDTTVSWTHIEGFL